MSSRRHSLQSAGVLPQVDAVELCDTHLTTRCSVDATTGVLQCQTTGRTTDNSPTPPGLAGLHSRRKLGHIWPKMGQIRDFFTSDFSTFWLALWPNRIPLQSTTRVQVFQIDPKQDKIGARCYKYYDFLKICFQCLSSHTALITKFVFNMVHIYWSLIFCPNLWHT